MLSVAPCARAVLCTAAGFCLLDAKEFGRTGDALGSALLQEFLLHRSWILCFKYKDFEHRLFTMFQNVKSECCGTCKSTRNRGKMRISEE